MSIRFFILFLYKRVKKLSKDLLDVRCCPINRRCYKKFKIQNVLIEHCVADHKRYDCTHCPKIRMSTDLHKRLRDIHGIIENAICEYCGHIIHSEAWKDKYKCVIYNKGFRSSAKLPEYSYIHSGKTDAYSMYQFLESSKIVNSYTFNNHHSVCITICQWCGKAFRFNSSISAHRTKFHAKK